MPARLAQQDDEMDDGGGLPSGRLGKLSKPRRGESTPPPSTLFSEERNKVRPAISLQALKSRQQTASRMQPGDIVNWELAMFF
jgi:hypothetical protein